MSFFGQIGSKEVAMSVDTGYVQLRRGLATSPVWEESNSATKAIFITLLMRAGYSDGSLKTSISEISRWSGVHRTTTNTSLKWLASRGVISMARAGYLVSLKIEKYRPSGVHKPQHSEGTGIQGQNRSS